MKNEVRCLVLLSSRVERPPRGKGDMTLVNRAVPFAAISCLIATSALAADRQIEEVVVTAEKREATVSDTSISITAFGQQAIEDFGLQGADDMVNYIPATTRDAYDIRIRGVGRNFRALGGDPGVATYYNGVYSPDFGIAASENALYDVARIEVLRGPQGTLYGRNSIGGALNYITNDPTMEWQGNLRTQFGQYSNREFYGTLSGPIIADKLAFRAVGVKRDRDGTTEGGEGSVDANSVDDRNISLGVTWNVSDNVYVKLRANDRYSNRVIGAPVNISEGAGPVRGLISDSQYAYGLRTVDATTPGAMAFSDPRGGTIYGAFVRPGVDTAATHRANGRFGHPGFQNLLGGTKDDPQRLVSLNSESGDCSFPYEAINCHHELFDHRASQNEINWDISDNLSVKYIFGTNDFEYTFNVDTDRVNSEVARYRQTVLEDVQSKSHEIQVFWSPSASVEITSGLYYFDELRKQDYSLTDTVARYTEAVDYGTLALPTPAAFGLGGASILQLLGFSSNHIRLGDAPVGTQVLGLWEGDPRGDAYHHTNTTTTEAVAAYSQATWDINDQFSLVLGLRWAEDKKSAEEIRGFYFELGDTLAFANGILPFLPGTAGLTVGDATGLTTLALQNIAMGNATYSGDPNNPLVPVCNLGDAECNRPLRLSGVPFSGSQTTVGSDEWGDTNFRINLDWTPNDDILMYFSVTTGYRSGGYSLGVTDARLTDPTTGGLVPATYDQEEVIAYEIGYKGLHLNNTLQVNASLYRYNYDNYQDRVNTFSTTQQAQVDIVQNADTAQNTGFEVETTWLPTDNWTVGGNYSYTKAEYTSDYFVAIEDDFNLPASLFGNSATAPELFLVNANGNQLKRIPKHKATVWGQYNIPLPGGSNLTLGGTYAYTGEYYDEGFEKEIDRIPSRFRLDLTATWKDASQRWELRAFARNVTDENNIRGVTSGSEATNWYLLGDILEPRFMGVDIRYNFGML